MAARSIKDAIAEKRLKRFIDGRLIRALSHPMREHLLAVFNERIASTSEIGRELDLGVPDIYHHVEELERLGCIERVESRQRRGAREHFFTAKATMLFDDRAWLKVPASVRSEITANWVRSILDDVLGSLRAGVFGREDGTHVSWLPAVFDKLGWEEVMALMSETLAGMMAIQRRSGERLLMTGEPGTPATIGLLGFETPSVPIAQARTR
jgi:DNA-binding MarR family transcriptional regulator